MRRPVFDQITQRVRTGQSDGVIVAKLDRFARTLVGALSTLEEFERHNAVLVSVADNLDLSTPMGKAFLRILLVFAELERDRISESWGTAISNAGSRGGSTSPSSRPWATTRAQTSDSCQTTRRRPSARRSSCARRTRPAPRSRAGSTRSPLARAAVAGRPPVERIIKNRVYMGEAYRGNAVNPDAHKPIVSVAEWKAANLVPVRAAHRGKRPNLLGGIARCAGCRYVLAPKVFGAGRPKPTKVYSCRALHSAGACPEPAHISRDGLDRYVERVWREQMANRTLSIKRDSQALQTAVADLQIAEDELAEFASDLTARRVLGTGYHAALEARAAAVDHAQSELQRASALALDPDAIEGYDDLPVEDRKRILSSSIDAVIVARGDSHMPLEQRVTILWRGEGPDDWPRRGRDNGPIRSYHL